jgi:hypothetical protein
MNYVFSWRSSILCAKSVSMKGVGSAILSGYITSRTY